MLLERWELRCLQYIVTLKPFPSHAWRFDAMGAWEVKQLCSNGSIGNFLGKYQLSKLMASRFAFGKAHLLLTTKKEWSSTYCLESFGIIGIIIFTDGSVMEGRSGSGFFFGKPDYQLNEAFPKWVRGYSKIAIMRRLTWCQVPPNVWFLNGESRANIWRYFIYCEILSEKGSYGGLVAEWGNWKFCWKAKILRS